MRTVTDKLEIEKLASRLMYYKKLYYLGQSIISDAEYDALEDLLRTQEPNHPVLGTVGYEFDTNLEKDKVFHTIPMLSLTKTYSIQDLQSFLNKYSCIVMDKFDGMALSLEYDYKGKLIQASTRGNGQLGENVTEHVLHVLSIPKNLKLSTNLPSTMKLEIRGEIYFPKSEFQKYENQFDSLRNAVPGTLGRKNAHEVISILNSLKFEPYDILCMNEGELLNPHEFHSFFHTNHDFIKKIALISSFGFTNREIITVQKNIEVTNLDSFIQELFNKDRDYHIDGLVFRLRDDTEWEALGQTSHHPRGSIAFKQAGETAETEILDIEIALGRSGKVTFRAKLKPVFLSGATISYATLHNAEFIEQGEFAPGAKVTLIRSGEVIPALLSVIEKGPIPYQLPTLCLCGHKLVRQGPDLICLEKIKCPFKDQESLVHFVSSLGIMGVSDKIIQKLRDAGFLKEPADLFKLTTEDLLQLEGFAEKSSENIIKAIDGAKNIPLAKFLTALGLKRGGAVKCQEVSKKCGSLEHVLELKAEDLRNDKGWAEKSATDFVESLNEKRNVIKNLLQHVVVLHDNKAKEELKFVSHPYHGKQICITGALTKPREQYKFALEEIGAKLVSSVSANTLFLVCNETDANSAKFKQAKKLNISIVSEEEFSSKL